MNCILVVMMWLFLGPGEELIMYQIKTNSPEECVITGYNELDWYTNKNLEGYFICTNERKK